MFYFLVFLLFLFFLLWLAWLLFNRAWRKGSLFGSLNFVLLEIKFPKILEPGEINKNREKFLIMERFYDSLAGLLKPYLVFEIAAPEKTDEIGFYLAVSKKFQHTIKRQILGFFPEAEIEPVNNFSVLNKQKAVAGSALKLKHNHLSFQTYKKLETSAIDLITKSLASLNKEKGDTAVLQILIRPIEKNLFEVNIRILASAETKEEAERILSDIESSFAQFELPDLNSFYSFRPQGAAFKKLIHNICFRLFNKKEVTRLSTEELTSVFHWPIVKIDGSKIRFLKAKAAPAPAIAPIAGIILGKNRFKGQETIIKLSPLDRRRHLFVAGQPGAGKNRLLKNLIRQDIDGGAGIGIIDFRGDLVDFIATDAPRRRQKDIILFNPADIKQPLNIDIESIMDNGKIFLANLSKDKMSEANSIFLERALLNEFQSSAFKRARKRGRITNRDFYLYINEFHESAVDFIANILAKTAENRHNINLTLASQFAIELSDKTGSLVAFRSTFDDAEFLAKYFQPVFHKIDLINIDENYAHAKLLTNGIYATPFNIEIEEIISKKFEF